MSNCILCKSGNVVKVETLKREDLNALYKKKFGIYDVLKPEHINFYSCSSCGLKFFYPLEAGDEEFYEMLQKYDWYYMSEKPEFEIALPWLEESVSILEVGAGTGSFAEYVGMKKYTGLEFNDAAILKASREGRTLLKESVQEHALNGKQYDAVACFQVLEHVPDVYDFIKGCVDCLKPGGKFIVAVPSHDGFCGSTSNNALDMPPHHITHWSERSLKSVADVFGVRCVSIEHEPVATFHYTWAQQTLILKQIKKALGVEYKLIDLSITHRILSKVASLIRLLMNVQLDDIKGHTVVAIYQKEN